MNVLVLNASPKKKNSNTLKLTKSFVQGIKSKLPSDIKVVEVYSKKIKDCIGCFNCWSKTPGKCIHTDDMEDIIQDILKADLIIWSFPLYYYSIPSGAKALMDRLLPMSLPFMDKEAERGGHPSRYDMSGKKYFLISSCGFYTAQDNYQAVIEQFNKVYGKGEYDYIFTGQGELFSIDQLQARTNVYLDIVYRAGEEYAEGQISQTTKDDLGQLLYPRKTFEEMADLHWGVEMEEDDRKEGQRLAEGGKFIRQMAALYNPKSWTKDRVLEFEFTDVGESYQVLMKNDGHQITDKDFLPFTTKIVTSLKTWQDIGAGRISGPMAMVQGLFSYEGEFEPILNWDEFFGQANLKKQSQKSIGEKKDPSMAPMLAPWIAMWVLLSIDERIGGALSILLSGLIQMYYIKIEGTAYDHLSHSLVICLSLLAIIGLDPNIILPISYLAFGLMWLVSSFKEIPLSAHYSKGAYGGDKAFDNPIFMKTNRIITRGWGLAYMLMTFAYIVLVLSPFSDYANIIVKIGPIVMSIFTVWFSNWYPASVARSK